MPPHLWTATRSSVLELDPSLRTAGCGGDADRRLTAPTMRIRPGVWAPRAPEPDRCPGWLGMYVLDGLLIRTVTVGGLECCELLGPGDVIRPWDRSDGETASLAAREAWRALDDVRVALLDDAFARAACRWPEVLATLMQRSLAQSRSLAVHLAIAQVRRADIRLMALFWHLADRWGRVTQEGVVVELTLTHGLLSRLTCLRRPTVSIALKELEAGGELIRCSRSRWLLRGTQPGAVHHRIGLPAAA